VDSNAHVNKNEKDGSEKDYSRETLYAHCALFTLLLITHMKFVYGEI
jgi:hypothetical protein